MNLDKLERAIRLGKKLEHVFIAVVDGKGAPHVNSARRIERIDDRHFAVEEWICPLTVKNLSENPQMAVVVWDPAADDGYEILGEVLMLEGEAFLNGYAPEVEDHAVLPQVKRRLIIRAERIAAFSHALRCDAVQPLSAEPPHHVPRSEANGAEISVCRFAPEWAEHARFDRDDAPCDDGRTGLAHPG